MSSPTARPIIETVGEGGAASLEKEGRLIVASDCPFLPTLPIIAGMNGT
jgi:hypothetical protein